MDLKQLKNEKLFQLVIGSILVIIILVILYKFYNSISKISNQVYLINKTRKGNYGKHIDPYTGQVTKINPYQHFSNSKLPIAKYGNGYSYSFWINVSDWEYNYGKPKHVFSKGDRAGVSVNPGVWLYPKDNNLMIRIDTFGRNNNKNTTQTGLKCQDWASQYPHNHSFTPENYPNDDLESNYCRNPDNKPSGDWCFTTSKNVPWESCGINNKNPPSMSPYGKNAKFDSKDQCDLIKLPLQRWNHIVLVLNNKTLDVYLNGKLARSCTYDGPPLFNTNPLHITDNGGFGGDIGELIYFNRSIGPSEVYKLYSLGQNTFNVLKKISKLKPNISGSIGIGNYNLGIGVGNNTSKN